MLFELKELLVGLLDLVGEVVLFQKCHCESVKRLVCLSVKDNLRAHTDVYELVLVLD